MLMIEWNATEAPSGSSLHLFHSFLYPQCLSWCSAHRRRSANLVEWVQHHVKREWFEPGPPGPHSAGVGTLLRIDLPYYKLSFHFTVIIRNVNFQKKEWYATFLSKINWYYKKNFTVLQKKTVVNPDLQKLPVTPEIMLFHITCNSYFMCPHVCKRTIKRGGGEFLTGLSQTTCLILS